MTNTQNTIASLLTQNTGRSMLDSGGHYGRNWEQNQGRDFENEPSATLSFKYEEVEYTHNVYHWLNERLDFEPEYHDLFITFCEDYDECQNLSGIQAWMEGANCYNWLGKVIYEHVSGKEVMDRKVFTAATTLRQALASQGCVFTGIYGEGQPYIHNTYNEGSECLLSQILQYGYCEVDGIEMVLLQIHGGCDARGGYTDAKVFTSNGNCELPMSDNRSATIYTEDGEHYWYKDGSCWVSDEYEDLEEYEFSEDIADKGNGKIYVDDDGNGYCPETGQKLVP